MDNRARLEKRVDDQERYKEILEHGFCMIDKELICNDCGTCAREG